MGMRDEIKGRREAIQGVRDQITELERLKETQLELAKSTKLTKEEWGAIQARVKGYDAAIQKATTNINQMSKDVNKVEAGLQKAEDRLDSFSGKIQDQVKKIPVLGESFAGGIQSGTDKAKQLMDKWLTDTDKGMRRKFKILGAVMAGLLLGGIIAIWKTFQNLLGKAKDTMIEMSTAINETARTIQMSTKDVQRYGKGVGDWVRYGQGWAGAISQIRDDMGFLPDLTTKENKLIGRLATNAGLGANEIANMYRHSQNMGKSLDQYVKDQEKKINLLNLELGVNTTQAEIVKEIAGASDATLAMFGKQNAELERQVLIGKKIGLNLNQQASMAKSLLDIESSIEAEMEARVLTGKEINFDKARELALSGDVSGAAEELMAQVGGINEFNKMNIIQKEALAKAAGMEVGQMQKALEMQAGIKDAAAVGGGAGGGGLEDAAANVSKEERDSMRESKWGKLLEKVAKYLDEIKIAIDDKLYAWFSTGPGNKILKGIEGFFKDLRDWIVDGKEPAWFTKFKEFIRPIVDGISKVFGFVKENPIKSVIAGGLLTWGAGKVKNMLGLGKMGTSGNPMHVTLGGKLSSFANKITDAFKKGPDKVPKDVPKKTPPKKKPPKKVGFLAKMKQKAAGLGSKIAAKGKGLITKIAPAAVKAASKAGSFFKKGLGKVGGFFSKIGKGVKSAAGAVKGVVKKGGGKVAAKGLGKSLLKKIPGVGALAGIGFGISRALKGDFSGAAMEVASGLLSTIPGAGTAASLALDAGLVAKDLTAGAKAVDPAPVEELSDFIYSPKFGAKKFQEDDLVVGGTKLDAALGKEDNKLLVTMIGLLTKIAMNTGQKPILEVDGVQLLEHLEMARTGKGME